MNSQTDWVVQSLVSLRDPKDRYSFTGGPFGSDLKSSDYTDSGIRVIQLQNIGDGHFINKHFIYTSEEKAEKLNNSQIFPGDILIAKMAEPLARACEVPNIEKKYVMCSDGIRLSVDKSKYFSKYVLYAINSKLFRDQAEAASTGTTRSRIGLATLKELALPVPPLKTQQKIANILSSIDEAIEKTDQIIEKTEKLKQGLMQLLLTKGIGHTKFKKTTLGAITDFIDYRGKTPDKVPGGIPLITAKNIRKGYIDPEPREFIKESDYETWMRRGIPQKGDILFTTEAPLGNIARLETNNKVAFAQRVIIIHPEPELNSTYLKFLLLQNETQETLHSLSSGGTVKGIKASTLKKLEIKVPTLDIQMKIASILESVDQRLLNEKKDKNVLVNLRKGLMQDIFSQKVKIN